MYEDTPLRVIGDNQTGSPVDYGPNWVRTRRATHAEREHIWALGYSRALASATRVHDDGPGRTFIHHGHVLSMITTGDLA